MSKYNIYTILEVNGLSCSRSNYDYYNELVKETKDEKEIVAKIRKYQDYIENNDNKYSEKIMQYLRQRHGLIKFDCTQDEDFNLLTQNEVFENVVSWNNLIGYSDTIKEWVKEVYGIDLNNLKANNTEKDEKELIEKVKDFVKYDDYNDLYRNESYLSHCDKYSDCYDAGREKGYSEAVHDLANIINGKEYDEG